MSQPKELSSPTPGSRTFTEIANDLVEVREALYDCTGSAFLSGDKGQPGDRYAIYLKLCAANNALWGIVEELQAISSPPSETRDIKESFADPEIMASAKAAWERLEHALDGAEVGSELKIRSPERYKVSSPSAIEPPADPSGDLEILRMALGNTATCLGDALATYNRFVGKDVFQNAAPAPTTWACGCGHTNGCNLEWCAMCCRRPNGRHKDE